MMFDYSIWTNENTLSLIMIACAIIGGVFTYIQ